jgi:hypothetical protein
VRRTVRMISEMVRRMGSIPHMITSAQKHCRIIACSVSKKSRAKSSGKHLDKNSVHNETRK